jgi:hypothetical protein
MNSTQHANLNRESVNWPTPRSDDAEEAGGHRGALDSLRAATGLWQTPGADSFRGRSGDRIDEPGLDRQARLWATPSSRDEKGEYQDHALVRSDGKMRGELLPDQASRFSRPTALETTNDGPQSSGTGPTSHRRLNPAFVLWLMGWPDFLVLSGYASPGTGLCHWLQRQRSALLEGGL